MTLDCSTFWGATSLLLGLGSTPCPVQGFGETLEGIFTQEDVTAVGLSPQPCWGSGGTNLLLVLPFSRGPGGRRGGGDAILLLPTKR